MEAIQKSLHLKVEAIQEDKTDSLKKYLSKGKITKIVFPFIELPPLLRTFLKKYLSK